MDVFWRAIPKCAPKGLFPCSRSAAELKHSFQQSQSGKIQDVRNLQETFFRELALIIFGGF